MNKRNTVKRTNEELDKHFHGHLRVARQIDGEYIFFTGRYAENMHETILGGSPRISSWTPEQIVKEANRRLYFGE